MRNIRLAMTPGYSRIILNDIVASAGDVDPQATCFSVIMMAILGGGERTLEETENLVDSAGLKIVKTFSNEAAVERVLELDLKD